MANRYEEQRKFPQHERGSAFIDIVVCTDCGSVVENVNDHNAHHSQIDGIASRLAVLDALLTGAVVERRVVGTFDSGVTSHVPIIAPEKEAETFAALQHAGAKDVHVETKVNGRWV